MMRFLAVVALVTLPLDLSLWYRSHRDPVQYRWDITLYDSVHVHVRGGVCGLLVVSMPVKTASRTHFQTPLSYDAIPSKASFLVSATRRGPYWDTWLVFPFWLSTILLVLAGVAPILQGPVRRWWRHRRGRCVVCDYDLRGTEGDRCSECGHPFQQGGAGETSGQSS